MTTTATASADGHVVAETDAPVLLEGNVYFPHDAVRWDHLEPSTTTSRCPWKGTASYFDVVVGGRRWPDAAWTYADPSPAAREIRGHVAFWRGVDVHR